MLEIIELALEDLLQTQNLTVKNTDRVLLFKDIIGEKLFSRQDYLRHNKEISTATGSRDLKEAIEKGLLSKIGDKRTTKYKFVQ